MGCYAEAVRAQHLGENTQPPLPVDTGWVVLTTGELSPRQARALFPKCARLLVVGAGARAASLGVSYGSIENGPPPRFAAGTLQDIERHCTCAVLLDGPRGTSGRLLLLLGEHGVRRVAWREGSGWLTASPRRLAFTKPLQRFSQHLRRTSLVDWYRRRISRGRAHLALRQRASEVFRGEIEWRAHLQRVGVNALPPRADGRLRVLLYIGQLNSGGAERQLCNLALALRRRGDAVRVVTTYALSDEDGHYLHLLQEGGVPVSVAGGRARRSAIDRLRALDIRLEVMGALPDVLRNPVLDLCGELLSEPPDVLHCWLDYPNIIGAAAGALVGAPHVVLSTRNVNPTHFPAFHQSWMEGWYAYLATLPQVHLVANSVQGAEDYARWLALPASRFTVIRNGVDLATLVPPGAAERARVRAELGIGDVTPLLAGVFRLAPEKQPDLFLAVVARVREQFPALKVALAGIGPLQADVERRVAALGLSDCVTLLGQRKDVPAILAAADALLLTSAVEGTPNVLLEAQWFGCPPVATAVGGSPDAVEHGATGYLHRADDAEGLARSVLAVLQDRALREELAHAGQLLVRERFSLKRMLDETLAHYATLLARGAPPPAADRSMAASPAPASSAAAAVAAGDAAARAAAPSAARGLVTR